MFNLLHERLMYPIRHVTPVSPITIASPEQLTVAVGKYQLLAVSIPKRGNN